MPFLRACEQLLLVSAMVLCAYPLLAQNTQTDSVTQTCSSVAPGTQSPGQMPADPKPWSFSVSTYTYFVSGSFDYVQPTFVADHGELHLEARCNYEALETGSAWVGYNFTGGRKVNWGITPMVGGVFGKTFGLAPAYKASAGWWKLALTSEGEYVIDAADPAESFLYLWSELSLAPVDWFRIGGAVQRTKVYRTDFDVQRGFLLGVTFEHIELTAYMFNPDQEPTFVLAASVSF